MSDQRANHDAYLDQVAARLRLPDDAARDVLEELRGHLAETSAGLMAEGLTAEQAERESIARLGNPDELADGIRTARQTRRRLLAAAGAGAVAATSGLVWGFLFAAALTTVARLGHAHPPLRAPVAPPQQLRMATAGHPLDPIRALRSRIRRSPHG